MKLLIFLVGRNFLSLGIILASASLAVVYVHNQPFAQVYLGLIQGAFLWWIVMSICFAGVEVVIVRSRKTTVRKVPIFKTQHFHLAFGIGIMISGLACTVLWSTPYQKAFVNAATALGLCSAGLFVNSLRGVRDRLINSLVSK